MLALSSQCALQATGELLLSPFAQNTLAGPKVSLASFKKFFTWMGAAGLVSPQTVAHVLQPLQEERDVFLAKGAESLRAIKHYSIINRTAFLDNNIILIKV